MKPAFIGIDIATESTRALLVDENANVIGTANAKLAPVIRGADGSVTQDPKSWVVAVASLLKEIQVLAVAAQVEPISLVISATSGTFTLVNGEGHAVITAAMYNDGRASSPLDRAIFIYILKVGSLKFSLKRVRKIFYYQALLRPEQSLAP